MRILHVAMECFPFSKVGGMADVTGALPAVLAGAGVESRVLTPHYPQLYKGPIGKELAVFDVWVGSAAHRVRLLEAGAFGILVDQPTAFDRPGISDDPATAHGYGDNLFRCLVLGQAARLALRQGVYAADVVEAAREYDVPQRHEQSRPRPVAAPPSDESPCTAIAWAPYSHRWMARRRPSRASGLEGSW